MAAATIGHYRVERLIKRGGMGAVYLGFDPELKRQAAIKVLRDDLEADDERERFRREAIAIAALDHPNIVRIYHTGVDNGLPYIAMEYVPGESLAELVRRDIALSLPRKLEIVEDVCSALGAAHHAGIVHRDIKPANILVAHDGRVKVVDFGIARTPDTTLTQLGTLVGTLDYMAPEQFSGGEVDHRTDIYAVGVLLYELVARTRPFRGDFHATLAARAEQRNPIPLATVCPEIDPAIASIVATALEHDPGWRQQDVRSLRQALGAVRRRLQAIDDETVVRPQAPAIAAPPAFSGAPGRPVPWRFVVPATGAGLLVFVLGLGLQRIVVAPPELPDVSPSAPRPRAASLPAVVLPVEIQTPAPGGDNRAAAPAVVTPVSPPVAPTVSHAPVPRPPVQAPSAPVTTTVQLPAPLPVPQDPPVEEPDRPVIPPRPVPPPAIVAPAAPVPVAGERQAVREIVDRYVQAMSDRNLVAMTELRTMDSAMRDALERQFRDLRSWTVVLVEPFVAVNLDASSARVTGRLKYQDIRSLDDRRGRVDDQNLTIELRKEEGRWRITDIQ